MNEFEVLNQLLADMYSDESLTLYFRDGRRIVRVCKRTDVMEFDLPMARLKARTFCLRTRVRETLRVLRGR